MARPRGAGRCLSNDIYIYILVGVLEHLDYFSIQLGISPSQLTFIFFRGVGIPPTRYGGFLSHGDAPKSSKIRSF